MPVTVKGSGRPRGRPRTPLRPEQLADLEAIRAGDVSWRRLVLADRWHGKVAFVEGYRAALLELERTLQDRLLAEASHTDVGRYAAMLADDTGIVRRLRFLQRALRSAENRRRQQRQTMPTWEQVRQSVYAETAGLLNL